VLELVKRGIRPLDIMTREAFENAITVVIALGGSTNAVLHLLGMAHAAQVPLKLDDFTRIGKRVPCCRSEAEWPLLDERTRGDRRPDAAHEDAPRGRPPPRRLHDRHRQNGGRESKAREGLPEGPGHHPSLQQPDQTGQPSRGALRQPRPGGAVAKISGKEGLTFSGKALVFENEQDALAAILDGTVKKGHVIVIRHEGPVGGPGMREMLSPTSAVMGKGLVKRWR
jgi:dihydroxy-acid dehydratase